MLVLEVGLARSGVRFGKRAGLLTLFVKLYKKTPPPPPPPPPPHGRVAHSVRVVSLDRVPINISRPALLPISRPISRAEPPARAPDTPTTSRSATHPKATGQPSAQGQVAQLSAQSPALVNPVLPPVAYR